MSVMLVAQSCPSLCHPQGLQHTRLLHLWDFQVKNPGVGCHSLLQGIFLTQGSTLSLLHWEADCLLCEPRGKLPKFISKQDKTFFLSFKELTEGKTGLKQIISWLVSLVQLCDPTDCSPPGSSVYGILQARILEWVAISFSRGPF